VPVVYVSNPKCGCSTVKNSLKQAQAAHFRRRGIRFEHLPDPHLADDCLRRRGLDRVDLDGRVLISCARNPYARVLSAYLDKVVGDGYANYRELQGRKPANFEDFLETLHRTPPAMLDPHFCPQHINLGLPGVTYDAIFYLENGAALQGALEALLGSFDFAPFAPHSRSAVQKVTTHYTPRAIELAWRIYAQDFDYFGYSRDTARVAEAPGAYRSTQGIVPLKDEAQLAPSERTASLKGAIRYQSLIERRLI